jgi:peptidoglycan/xylan/chitin deacetylase (PgdA/CDA1 family)
LSPRFFVIILLLFTTAIGLPASGQIINHGSRSEKVVVLTFDADMTPKMQKDLKSGRVKKWYDERIIQILEKNSVPATIFATGLWAQTYPEAVKKIAKNSLFEIGNHSFSHPAFKSPCYGLAPVKGKEGEVIKTQAILYKLTGQKPKFFRFPGGCFTDEDVSLINNLGLQVIGWDVISGDSVFKNERQISDKVLKEATNGSIVVMHLSDGPNAPKTSAALPAIIKGLKEKGFSFVSLSRLMI